MITQSFNYSETPEDLIASLLTEGGLRDFLVQLDLEYNDPQSTLQTGRYVKLRHLALVKIQLLQLHGPA